jgi:leucyl-tRNA synthetase
LAYQAEKAQWWCEKCKTVLANEQVIDGKCWRHDSDDDPFVIKKHLKQWFFKITDYADELLDTTDALEWPPKIKTMQKNWIGKSHGVTYINKVKDIDLTITSFSAHYEAFTANTFVAIAPDHPMLKKLVDGLPNADQILAKAQDLLVRRDALGEKGADMMEGIFTGRYAVDFFGDEDLPIWITSYALADYGTGIVLCSAHDDRDFEFAKKYSIRLKPTLFPSDPIEAEKVKNLDYCYSDTAHGILQDSAEFSGKIASENHEAIADYLVKIGYATKSISYKMRDWLISRQRYWGAPIPILYCDKDGVVAVPEKDLPVILPKVENFAPDGSNHSVLAGVADWVNTICPKCGGPAKRETDTMDGYACSSWYMYRYTDAHNDHAAWDPDKADYWFPVDYYFGGDHAISHLLYFRFWHKFFCDIGLVGKKVGREPIKRLVFNGYINAASGAKMSKSKGNTIDPMEIINSGYGADALRVFELFIAPYDQDTSWNTNGVPGTHRFLNRVWTLVQEYIETKSTNTTEDTSSAILRATHKTIKKVTDDMTGLSFNTAVAAMMEFTNTLYLEKAKEPIAKSDPWVFAVESIIQLLGPFAPYIAEEMWHEIGHDDTVHKDHWPSYDESYLKSDTMTIAVQVNGKLRATLILATNTSKEDVIKAVMADEKVQTHLGGKEPIKTIYVPSKLVSLVVTP